MTEDGVHDPGGRGAALDALEQAGGGEAPPLELSFRAEALFLALHGAPPEAQVELARSVLLRGLPVFHAGHPGEEWTARLLADPGAWHAAHGSRVPDPANTPTSAGALFLEGIDLLLIAWEGRGDVGALCSAAAGAVAAAVHARAEHVWEHDDPEGVDLREQRLELLRGGGEFPLQEVRHLFDQAHEPMRNAAFLAVARREWAFAAARLRELLPDGVPYDPAAALRDLERWREAGNFPLPPASGTA